MIKIYIYLLFLYSIFLKSLWKKRTVCELTKKTNKQKNKQTNRDGKYFYITRSSL